MFCGCSGEDSKSALHSAQEPACGLTVRDAGPDWVDSMPNKGNQYTCPDCHHAHRFLPALAGQTMHCKACGWAFRIPLVPLARAEGVDFSQAGRWLLRQGGGRQFGPVRREMILEWLHEGRADLDCLVSPEGSSLWYRITEVFPQPALPKKIARKANPASRHKSSLDVSAAWDHTKSTLFAAACIPASGLLDLWEDSAAEPALGRMRTIHRYHAEALLELAKESALSGGCLRQLGTKLVWLEDDSNPRPNRRGAPCLTVEAAAVSAWIGPQGREFYCIIPWSRFGRLPHEFLSILPGRLPGPVALRRATEDAFAGGRWIGISGDDRDVTTLAATISQENLAGDVMWDWHSKDRDYHMIQVWGVQGIPLGPGKFAHLIQTAVFPDPGQPTGLRWYLERQSAFWRFARRLNLPPTPGSPVLFASCAARLLVLAADRLRESPVA